MDPTSHPSDQQSNDASQFTQQNAPQYPYPADTQTPPYTQPFPTPFYMAPTQDMIQKLNGFSLTSMILGIFGILSSCTVILGGIFGALGLIFGIIGLSQQKSGRFTGSSKGFGIAGVVTSIVSLLLVIIFVLLVVAGNGHFQYNSSGTYGSV